MPAYPYNRAVVEHFFIPANLCVESLFRLVAGRAESYSVPMRVSLFTVAGFPPEAGISAGAGSDEPFFTTCTA